MANYTAADVKRLRELTGSGMMDCKNALAESDGDFDKAVELLRIKGAKDVGKRAERATAEGLVAAKDGALIELNSETDFVAKNGEFQELANQVVAAAAAAKVSDADALKAAKVGDTTVEQAIADLSAKIGEKLELRRAAYFDGTVETYLHKRAADLPPAVGVLVEYTAGDADKGKEAAHAVALQIAALKAKYLTREDVPADIVANERRIAEETAKEEGKPEQALPKIIEGRVTGFYKDVVLLDQPSVSDNKKTVKALLDEAGVALSAVDAIAFGRGPGAFTGVRIAIGVVQGLAFALQRPVLAVSDLAILAQRAYREQGAERVAAAIDARMDEVYWGCYQLQQGEMRLAGSEAVLPPERVAVPWDAAAADWFGAGTGWGYVERMPQRPAALDASLLPHAEDLLSLAGFAWARGEGVEAEQALPVYLRDNVATPKKAP